MKSLIVYSSQSGNTKKLADVVYENAAGDKEIFPVSDAPDPDDYDFIAVGFWLQAGKPDPKTLEYLPKIGDGKKLFLFATHGAASDSDHAQHALNVAKELTSAAALVGTFSCQGEVNPKVLEKVKSKPQPPVWLTDAPEATGHPDDQDVENLKRVLSGL